MIRSNHIISFFFLLTLTQTPLLSDTPEYPARITVEGRLQTWSWANTGNRLALVTTNEAGSGICIIEAEPLKSIIQVTVPDYLEIRDVEWTVDDSGLIILAEKCAECPEGVACFDFTSLSFIPDYRFDYIRFSSADQRWAVDYDPESRSWATDASGEGHPDIKVSRDGDTIMSTNVYPGTVGLIGWRAGKLYFSSFLNLQSGLNRNGVLTITPLETKMDDTDENHLIYSLDIETANLKQEESLFIPDITQASKNGLQYYFQFNIASEEDKTEIIMW